MVPAPPADVSRPNTEVMARNTSPQAVPAGSKNTDRQQGKRCCFISPPRSLRSAGLGQVPLDSAGVPFAEIELVSKKPSSASAQAAIVGRNLLCSA